MKYLISFSFLVLHLLKASSQNVGIGTTTPLEKLSVVSVGGYGISHESSAIKLSTYIDGNGAYLGTVTNSPFHLYTNNGVAQFTLLQNGNIGIGNISPAEKFNVTTPDVNYGISHSAAGIKLASFIGNPSAIFGTTTNHNLELMVNNTPYFLIKPNGYTAIGNGVDPLAKLDIHFNSNLSAPTLRLYETEPGDYTRLQFQNSSGSKYWHIAGYIDNTTNANSKLNFYHSATGDIMSISGNGNIGIGTINPLEKMDINGNLLASGNLTSGGIVTANNFQFPSARTFYHSIPPAAFNVMENGTIIKEHFVDGVYQGFGFGIIAPLELPHASVLSSMNIFYYDNSSAYDLLITLYRKFHSGSPQVMGQFISTGTPGNTQTTLSSLSNPTISNIFYHYYITAQAYSTGAGSVVTWPGNALILKAISLSYTKTQAD